MTDTIRAFAPATVSNVGPGFDCFGFALDGLGDAVEITRRDEPGITLTIHGDGGRLPARPQKNCASVVAYSMLESAGADFGLDMLLGKGLPAGTGLGSSGASSAVAAVATNAMLGNRFSPEELIRFAALGEEVACGTAHLDNVAPAILGGFVIVRHGNEVQAVAVPAPHWPVAVCLPHLEIETRKARAALPQSVPLADLTRNVSNAASLVVALGLGDLELFGRALMSDCVVEPVRAALIEGYDAVRDAALSAGAAGVSVAGSGPALFAVAENDETALAVGEAMRDAWNGIGVASSVHLSRFGARGARVVE